MLILFIYLWMCKYVCLRPWFIFNIRENTVKIIHLFSLQEVPPTDCPESVVFERNMLKIHNMMLGQHSDLLDQRLRCALLTKTLCGHRRPL